MSKNTEHKADMLYEPHILPDPQIPFIFHMDTRRYGNRDLPNWHTNLELLFATKGRGIACLDSIDYPFAENEIVVVNSHVLHATYAETGTFVYDCLIIDHNFCKECGIDTDNLIFETVVRDEALAECCKNVRRAYADASVCRAAKIRRAVLDVLITLREAHTLRGRDKDFPKDIGAERVKDAMIYIRQNLREPLSLADIAAHAGISKYYFAREFKRVTGQTAVEYINIARCKEAKRRIREGASVSEAAQTYGFENLSYFTRTYKKYIGELPSKKAAVPPADSHAPA